MSNKNEMKPVVLVIFAKLSVDAPQQGLPIPFDVWVNDIASSFFSEFSAARRRVLSIISTAGQKSNGVERFPYWSQKLEKLLDTPLESPGFQIPKLKPFFDSLMRRYSELVIDFPADLETFLARLELLLFEHQVNWDAFFINISVEPTESTTLTPKTEALEVIRPANHLDGARFHELLDFKKVKLENTVWYLYHYDNDFDDSPFSTISRLLLHFQPDGKVKLYDKADTKEFTGTAFSHKENKFSISIDFIHDENKHKDLHIRFTISQRIGPDSLFIGQYIDEEERVSYISGNIILESALGQEQGDADRPVPLLQNDREIFIGTKKYHVVSRRLSYETEWSADIPVKIAKFLVNKWMNFTKASTVISTQKKFKDFVDRHEREPIRNKKYNSIIQYDVFMIVPKKMGKTEYALYQDTIEPQFYKYSSAQESISRDEVDGAFAASESMETKFGITRIYNSRRTKMLPPHSKTSKSEIELMKQSKEVFVVITGEICSTSMIQIGWAMEMEKLIWIFCPNKDTLPSIIRLTIPHKLIVPEDPLDLGAITTFMEKNWHEAHEIDGY